MELKSVEEFPYPYIASFSPLLRLGVRTLGSQAKMQEIAEGVVTDIVETEGVAASLKTSPVPGTQTLRQVDIRPHPGSDVILLKCFVRWDAVRECWHVLMQGSMETYWDGGKEVINRG